jgi:DNA-binding NarL/FixJ family response regulator
MESTAAPEPVRLFLVGLSEGLARSLARLVSGDSRVALTGVAPSLALAGLLLPQTQPDLVLLDWTALKGNGPDAVQALRIGRPGLRIVCVAREIEAYRAAALENYADAVISRDGFAQELEPLLRGFFPERFGASGAR